MKEIGLEWQVIDSPIQFKETTTPATPYANKVKLYAIDSSGISTLAFKNDAGTEFLFPTSGSIISGTGVATRVAFFSAASVLTSDADMTFVTDTLTVTKIIAPTSVTISTLTLGSIVFAGTAGLLTQDNTNLFWDDTNNRLGLGTAVPGFQFHGVAPDASSFNFNLDTYGTAAVPNYRGRAARGTLASASALQADDLILALSGLPYGQNAFASAARAQIRFNAGENLSNTAQGTYIGFFTTALTTTTTAERFRIGPSGQWGIGGATYGSAGSYFRSAGASAAPVWSTLILPNAATANRIVYASATDTYGESANLTYDGTDFGLGSGTRARMQSQNRFRYLNAISRATLSGALNTNTVNAWFTATFGSEDFDTDTMHDTGSNTSKLTAKVAGKYCVMGTLLLDSTNIVTPTQAAVRILINGGTSTVYGVQSTAPSAGFPATALTTLTGACVVSLAVNDYVEVQGIVVGSSGTFDIKTTNNSTLQAFYIGE